MKYLVQCALVVVVAVYATASAEADFGYFIPKAFYTLDADGHKTQPHPVSSHTAQYLRRLRRQVFSSSSSSSSSSASSSNGGPVYFNTQNTVSHTPGGTVSFSSRFGDDGSSSTSSHSSSGIGGGVGSAYGGNGYGNNGYDNTGFAGHYGATGPSVDSRFGSSGSAASSSSSVSSNGGPVYFKTEQSVSHSPSNINLASRFGGDTPQTVSKTVSTSGYIDAKGVHAKTTTTKNH